jgi:putative Mg2+ transporter-C (MgtC) family protein
MLVLDDVARLGTEIPKEILMSEILSVQPDVLVRLLMASLLGGLIGLERDVHGRAAGLRTHLLVSLGAAVFMVLSEYVARVSTGTFSDPGRIAAQIVTGIGFLGAGAIIKEGVNIRGLTTAACLWTVAAVGMAAGAGLYVLAAVTTAIALVCLIFLKKLERLYSKDSYRFLTVMTPLSVRPSRIIEVVKTEGLTVLHCNIEKDYERDLTVTRLAIRIFHKGVTDKMAHGVIETLEASSIQLKEIRWDHASP